MLVHFFMSYLVFINCTNIIDIQIHICRHPGVYRFSIGDIVCENKCLHLCQQEVWWISLWGVSINYVDKILGIFDPPPPSRSLLLNKAYFIKCSFGLTLFPLYCPRGLWLTLWIKLKKIYYFEKIDKDLRF